MKKKSFPSTERGTWRAIHTATCLVVEGERLPHIHKSPLRLAGRTHLPGARFIYFGGNKTSAGFECLDFRDFAPMTYIGQILDQHIADMTSPPGRPDGLPLALFSQGDKPGPGSFYAWHYDEQHDGVFFWGTDSNAGRVIEHDRTALEGESMIESPHAAKKAPGISDRLRAYKADGMTADQAITSLILSLGKLRQSRRDLRKVFDSLPDPKPQAFDPAAHPSWWRCPECWTEWSVESSLRPPCPACNEAGEPLARWWRKDERDLCIRLDAAIGLHGHPYPPAQI